MTALVLAALVAGTVPASPAADARAEAPIVASVRLEGDPEDRARLERYIEVKPGAPLEAEVVRHIVELFYATGEYADVVVETSPAASGVDVVFRLVKAPLLSEVHVEGDGVLKPEAVGRTTRLRAREPLWPARLEQAARELALSLAERGYLEARVTADAAPRGGRRGCRLHDHLGAARPRGRRAGGGTAGGHGVALRRNPAAPG